MLQFEGLVRALGPSLAAARAVLSSSEQGAPHGAKTCADLRVRALVLRYLCAVRPWLLSEREGTPSRMQEASVVRWLTKGSRDRSQKAVLSTLSELIESAGRALAGLGAGGAGGAGELLLGSRLEAAMGLSSLEAGVVDLVHAASGADPDIFETLAQLGVLRPADAAADASVAKNLIDGATGDPELSARLEARGLFESSGEQLGGAWRIPEVLCELARPRHAADRGVLRLQRGVEFWPAEPIDSLVALGAAAFPEVVRRSASQHWLLSGGQEQSVRRMVSWIANPANQGLNPPAIAAPEPGNTGNTAIAAEAGLPLSRFGGGGRGGGGRTPPDPVNPANQGLNPQAILVFDVDRIWRSERSHAPRWLEAASHLQPCTLLLRGCAENLVEGALDWVVEEGEVFVSTPRDDVEWVHQHLEHAAILDLDHSDFWEFNTTRALAALPAHGQALAGLWTSLLTDVHDPVERVHQLGRLHSLDVVQRETLRDAVLEARVTNMDALLDKRVRDPGCPMILAESTRDAFEETRRTVEMCGRVRRGEVGAKSHTQRIVILLEGERSVVQRKVVSELGLAWGQPVYEIDVSKVLSRYIGEAEKELSAIFEKAKRSGCGLFLDEAQGLLGKRTEVKRSADRYSGMQVNFVLQALDEFDGLFILASSAAGDLDPAIARRILYRIDFRALDETQREAYWQALLPAEAPVEDDLSWYILAEDFELSPDQIHSAMLQGAVAAAMKDEPISLSHLVGPADRVRR